VHEHPESFVALNRRSLEALHWLDDELGWMTNWYRIAPAAATAAHAVEGCICVSYCGKDRRAA
jgi:hypothetical protein